MTSNLEKLGVTVSRLGFGIMRMPTLDDGKIDRTESLAMIDRAYRAGVNYFDTAYGYHNGESELLVKEALSRYPRGSYYLADKMPPFFCKKESDVKRIFTEQLSKCGVDYFDFYMFHALDRKNWDKMVEFKALEKLLRYRSEGKIRFIGFSYHGDFDTFCEILDAYNWDFVQLQINYIDYDMLEMKRFHSELTGRGIPCVVMEPVRGGFLANLPESALKQLKEFDPRVSSAEWAFRWCISMENMPLILSGMSSTAQVEQNIEIFSGAKPLSKEEFELIDRVRETVVAIKTVPCTGCAYCMDCPSGVDIPGVMRAYNDYKLFGNQYAFNDVYKELGEKSWESCADCGVCSPLCPQSIDIPGWMRSIGAEFEEKIKF